MISNIFQWATQALNGSILIAITASFIWGVLSMVLSPCHLSSIPLIIGYISVQGKIGYKKALFISISFALGILMMISIIGLITGLMGRMLGDIGNWGNYFVAGLFILIGLYLLNLISLPSLNFSLPVFKNKNIFTVFILGLLFGLSLGPCTYAYMAPMLGIVFKIASQNLFFAFCLLAAYGIGHCGIIILAGTSTELVQHYLNWHKNTKFMLWFRWLCGIILILLGVRIIF